MTIASLVLLALYLALAFGGRTLVQLRSTGSTGFKGISGRPFSAEWAGGVLFVAAVVLFLAAPLLALAGAAEPIAALDGPLGHALGFVLFFAGLTGTLVAQWAMGRSWRIGVDEKEKTELVTAGPFALVRNPIFSAMVPAFAGLALLVPNAASLLGAAALVAAVEIQVRLVEEPYLLRAHGARYAGYASRVGRFVPGVGLLRAAGVRPPRARGGLR
ncbi:isoprenylcysteine carboxylmethyltransferase family protein (plasmid) [Rubrobacter tropicus]|uniref:Isoprenylcysteine carboxylmethyltransferase family protein n=1 Tax=Rubrobacter tropicus TaxID=2653851 RepID=A0A6G8QFV0_9ACTN|nr:isoprenylcysteine carboxylmethyltransferase family protein [Rubrobacter tropicus]QIN85369.1 isoprenylcysteine carboxylmethyltransferase family protein [Rubrobacter tropicus]